MNVVTQRADLMSRQDIMSGPRQDQNPGRKTTLETGAQKQSTPRARTVRARGLLRFGGSFRPP